MQFQEALARIRPVHVIAGAVALGIGMGAVGGTFMDPTLVQNGKTLADFVAEPSPVAVGWDAVDAGLPDHYAVETRNGRFEVWELSSRGLLRAQLARYDYLDARYEPDGEALIEEEPVGIEDDTIAPPADAVPLAVEIFPGGLEQPTAPIPPEVILEPATAHLAGLPS